VALSRSETLWSLAVIRQNDVERDLATVAVPTVGSLEATGEAWEPYRLVDPAGEPVAGAQDYLKHLQAMGRAPATLRSYGMDLLRWFRFLWAIELEWDQATRAEARDFARRLQLTDKPARARRGPTPNVTVGETNAVTGKPSPGPKYAPATAAHTESVLRHFYDFHLDEGTGPIVNPFPLARHRGRGANAHRSPMQPHRAQRSGQFRPRLPQRVPRNIPDDQFNKLFARMPSVRDRALMAFWISTGARASELLGARQADADPGQQLITVVRKGTRALQQLPASPDAFVWLRLYQAQTRGLVPSGRPEPLWWTLRRPFRALSYDAARMMFGRVNAALGANWTLHDLRHSAAYRMARDPDMPLTDVQWVLGHAHLTTTQIYTSAPVEDVIASVLAHHTRQHSPRDPRDQAAAVPLGYRSESLDILFRRDQR
jgi:site-specific recombinase XerD